jgi:hypothetical protein
VRLVSWLTRHLRSAPVEHPMASRLRETADRQDEQAKELVRLRALQKERGIIQRRPD